jgi:hypothetical protein
MKKKLNTASSPLGSTLTQPGYLHHWNLELQILRCDLMNSTLTEYEHLISRPGPCCAWAGSDLAPRTPALLGVLLDFCTITTEDLLLAVRINP